MRFLSCLTLLVPAVLAFGSAMAEVPQTFSARIGGVDFAGDDDTILLVPVMGTFTLSASTQGAASYPPPKTPVDRFSVTCTIRTPAAPARYDSTAFSNHNICHATFTRGADASKGTSEVEYEVDTRHAGNLLEITSQVGKVIEGRFKLTMKAADGSTLEITDGRFKAEDRQI